jgi:hypothetical protein
MKLLLVSILAVSLPSLGCHEQCKNDHTGPLCFQNDASVPLQFYGNGSFLYTLNPGQERCADVPAGKQTISILYEDGRAYTAPFKRDTVECIPQRNVID